MPRGDHNIMSSRVELMAEVGIRGVVLTGAMFHCSNCGALKPADHFGLRMMAGGVVRNQAQCGPCRNGNLRTAK